MARIQSKLALAASATFTVTGAVASGNGVVGAVAWEGGAITLTNITDNQGNTYSTVDTKTDSLNGMALVTFQLLNITNGPTVVTANFSSAPASPSIVIHEVSGLLTGGLDQHTTAETATLTANATATAQVTPSTDGQYIFGVAINSEEAFGALHAGTSPAYTVGELQNSTYPFMCSEDLTQTTAAAIAATFTCDSIRRCQIAIMTFKPATGSVSKTPTVGGGALTPVLAVPVRGTVAIPLTP